MTVELLNVDCMEYMATQPDGAFDLAVVDPPYGIGENGDRNASRSKPSVRMESAHYFVAALVGNEVGMDGESR